MSHWHMRMGTTFAFGLDELPMPDPFIDESEVNNTSSDNKSMFNVLSITLLVLLILVVVVSIVVFVILKKKVKNLEDEKLSDSDVHTCQDA